MSSKEENLSNALHKALPGKLDIHVQRHRRVWAKLKREDLRAAADFLSKGLGFEHLAVIAAVDLGTEYALNYHFFHGGILLTLKVPIPKDDPRVPTITDIFPGAVLYEREFLDVMGIVPDGHPNPARLILPDDWEGGHPLRKDWTSKAAAKQSAAPPKPAAQSGGESDG